MEAAIASTTIEMAPESAALEEKLAQIWCEIIRVEEVNRGDDLFDLGAHSLLVAQIISRVRTEFGVELTMRQVFDAPKFGEFLALVMASRPSGSRN